MKGNVDAYTTSYRDRGRVAGGLANQADRIYGEAGPDIQSSLQAVMFSLAEMDEDGRIRRRRAAKKELPPAVYKVLEQFVSARLLIAFEEDGVEYVEVAHEALFTSWPLYSRWLADAEAHLKLSRRLERDAREWAKSAESAIYLWTGERLAAAETMLEASGLAADHPARRFLAVSMASDRRMREREANFIAARIEAEHQRLPVASPLAAAAAVDRYGPTPQLERAIRSALVRSERGCVYAVGKGRGGGRITSYHLAELDTSPPLTLLAEGRGRKIPGGSAGYDCFERRRYSG